MSPWPTQSRLNDLLTWNGTLNLSQIAQPNQSQVGAIDNVRLTANQLAQVTKPKQLKMTGSAH